MEANGLALIIIPRSHLPSLTLSLQINDDGSAVNGTLADGTGTAQLFGEITRLRGRADSGPPPGNYSMDILTDSDGSFSPGHGSAGRMTVSPMEP